MTQPTQPCVQQVWFTFLESLATSTRESVESSTTTYDYDDHMATTDGGVYIRGVCGVCYVCVVFVGVLERYHPQHHAISTRTVFLVVVVVVVVDMMV